MAVPIAKYIASLLAKEAAGRILGLVLSKDDETMSKKEKALRGTLDITLGPILDLFQNNPLESFIQSSIKPVQKLKGSGKTTVFELAKMGKFPSGNQLLIDSLVSEMNKGESIENLEPIINELIKRGVSIDELTNLFVKEEKKSEPVKNIAEMLPLVSAISRPNFIDNINNDVKQSPVIPIAHLLSDLPELTSDYKNQNVELMMKNITKTYPVKKTLSALPHMGSYNAAINTTPPEPTKKRVNNKFKRIVL